MSYEAIIFDKNDKIAKVTLNRPERMNTLDIVMRRELKTALAEIASDKEIRVMILTGTGKGFCAGGDLSTMAGMKAPAGRDRVRDSSEIISMMMEMEKPIIAAVNGVAVGAGMHIAIAADIIIAADNARFKESFVNVGLIPDLGGFYNLPMRVGIPKAKELMMTAQWIEARDAESMGLVNKMVSSENLMSEVESLAATLADGPSRAFAMIKSTFNQWPLTFRQILEIEANLQAVAFETKDFDEGRRAFLEKRKPNFTGE